jgi:murein DD-endopeptidase MepM/ murein hydrolase activator NlpD
VKRFIGQSSVARCAIDLPGRRNYSRNVKLNVRAAGVVLGIGTAAAAVTLFCLRQRAPISHPRPAPPAPAIAPTPQPVTETLPIRRGDTLDQLLARSGVGLPARAQMVSAVQAAFDVTKFRAGSQLALTRNGAGAPESLRYVIDPDHALQVSQSAGGFQAAVVEIPGTIRVSAVCGTMQDSLFESMERIGERAELAMQVADVFAWDIDFYSDPQPGDEFCLVLEKKEYDNGQPATCRRILAARYDNAGTVYEGYLFPDRGGSPRYYSADGRSLQSAFLRSPLKFDARVSSHFSRRRFHPLLKIYRPHLGTDYAAPVGAPVQAVASGRVTFTGRAGGGGKTVRIRHANGYQSAYLHLSRIFVKPGQHVEQGQRIAAVGATGLATGPHLDFRLIRNGRSINFERFRPPRVTQLGRDQMAAFALDRGRLAALMEEGRRSLAATLAKANPSVSATAEGAN